LPITGGLFVDYAGEQAGASGRSPDAVTAGPERRSHANFAWEPRASAESGGARHDGLAVDQAIRQAVGALNAERFPLLLAKPRISVWPAGDVGATRRGAP
jgi:hypothetical protein